MTQELIAIANGIEVGSVFNRNGRLSFMYEEAWRQDATSYPLSLSMPLTASDHSHARIDAFLWGLLPDNERVLERWAKRFQVSARNSFRLLAHVGEDCAGAVQFVSPERLEAFRKEPTSAEIAWLTEMEIAGRLRDLRADHSAWRTAGDTGQFSLAGAQPKTALLRAGDRWGVPSGRTPTTHILKPPTGEWDGHAENEHFCLLLARACGLIVPNSNVERFENEVAIVIERYDRRPKGRSWVRIHQEDMCQALGLRPTDKYQNDGGPGVSRIVEFLQERSSAPEEDVLAFVDAIAFNWLIAGTDAHAKNYSLLLGERGIVRLAPLYDLASILPYPHVDLKKIKLAMKIGGEYRVENIGIRQWRRLAAEVRIGEDVILGRVGEMATRFPELLTDVQKQVMAQGLTHKIISTLCHRLEARSGTCREILGI